MFFIEKTHCGYESEPLVSPFGFKGNALTELWQIAVSMEGAGARGAGLGVQSILWSDADVFAQHGEAQGNKLMLEITRYALTQISGRDFATPVELLDFVLPKALAFGREITGSSSLRATFVLNALVPVDNAAWLLYAAQNKMDGFDDMVGRPDGLPERQKQLANIPLITYHTPLEEVRRMAEEGVCLFKIKVGSDPQKDGDLEKMLRWDCARLSDIHGILGAYRTNYTESGHILYYLDANGRYDSKQRLFQLLEHTRLIGALDRIVLLEEPFPEEDKSDVSDIPVCVAADESAHGLEDVAERIRLGYRAITLKPIAKTLSMTLKIADYAHAKGIACFCADLTVNPVLAEWNKNVAARLPALPGMKIGVIESNGAQNYTHWEQMRGFHPMADAAYARPNAGIYPLNDAFYATSGGIFLPSAHYMEISMAAQTTQ